MHNVHVQVRSGTVATEPISASTEDQLQATGSSNTKQLATGTNTTNQLATQPRSASTKDQLATGLRLNSYY